MKDDIQKRTRKRKEEARRKSVKKNVTFEKSAMLCVSACFMLVQAME